MKRLCLIVIIIQFLALVLFVICQWLYWSNAKKTEQRIQGGMAALARVIRPDSTCLDAHAWENLGDIYIRFKDYSNACEAYIQATELEPENSQYWSSLSATYVIQEDYNNAKKALQHLVMLLDDGPERTAMEHAIDQLEQVEKSPRLKNKYKKYIRRIKKS